MRSIFTFLCLAWLSANAADIRTDEAKASVAAVQTAYKASNPRYFQQLTNQPTADPKITYTIERYTHGNKGEGYVINWFRDDGGIVSRKRENFGPAEYLAHDWNVKSTNKVEVSVTR